VAATLAAHSAPRLIVLNKSDNTMVVIDPAALKVMGKVPTGEGPHEAAITADGKFAVVANYGAMKPGNSLSVIDIDALKEKERVDLGALTRPHGIQTVKDKIYFTSETTRSVARFDPATAKIDWLMGTGASASHMLVVSADGRRLYTSNIASNNVTAIRLDGPASLANSAQGIAPIAVGPQPEAIDMSPDGREVWVGHNGDGGVSIIDAATNAVSATMKVGSLPIRLKFSPDGKWVFVSDPRGGEGEVIVIDAAKREVVSRIKVPGVPLGLQFSADGKTVYVSRTQAGRVDAIDVVKREVVGSVETGNGPDGLAWRN
jgi:YVTN family beta-propeller protein